MTYSLVARDPDTGQLGAAIQSAAFTAGVHTLWVEAGVGAVATQSFTDPSYGPMCLLALRSGATAADALAGATRRDRLAPYRQVGVVSAAGTAAAFTGKSCIADAGHVHRKDVACQANMMASATVWPAMIDAFRAAKGTLADRLVTALEAAQAEGGDWRGQEAGRVLVVAGEPSGMPWKDVVCDVRVDNHPEPVAELRRLVSRSQALRAGWAPDPDGSVAATVAAARAAGLEEAHVVIAALRTAVVTGEVDEARAHFERMIALESRYLDLVRRLPDVPQMLGLEPVLPLPGAAAVSSPGAGRAGSRGPRSGPARP
ncbi:MAG TPA: DUF1028 domain-containing protein [Gaiellales bacterium]